MNSLIVLTNEIQAPAQHFIQIFVAGIQTEYLVTQPASHFSSSCISHVLVVNSLDLSLLIKAGGGKRVHCELT